MAIKFRSKLEKECSEALGKEWKYEPCRIAYTIRKNYTPDFVKGKFHIEVKGFFRSATAFSDSTFVVSICFGSDSDSNSGAGDIVSLALSFAVTCVCSGLTRSTVRSPFSFCCLPFDSFSS